VHRWIFILFLFPGIVLSQEVWEIPLVEGFNFDGIPDESFWDQAKPFPLVTQLPDFGLTPSEKTEILLVHDGEHLILAGRMFEMDASKIMSNSFKRDVVTGNTDWLGIMLDTYNDKENALAFFTNPNGLRTDFAILNDAVGENPLNLDWNNFWDVKTEVNKEGWFVELRIPFSSLQFQVIDGTTVMAMSTFRYIARKNEVDIFPDIPPIFGDHSPWKPSRMHEISIKGIRQKRPFYITPYLLGGLSYDNKLNDVETKYIAETNPKFEAGMDIKCGISNNLTLDLSVNTDFAQVEADDEQVNLTRFSLFFPEKRLFFQERSGIFEIRTGGPFNRFFYSRRIGIDDDGNPVRILGGARLTGRIGSWDIGFLNMQTSNSTNLNAENFSVLRLRKQVLNPNSYLGLMMTNRMDFKGSYNTLYGFDALLKIKGDDYLQIRLAQTLENLKDNNPVSLDPTRIFINLERRRLEGLIFDLAIGRMGRDYNPAMGFESRENFSEFWNIWKYAWVSKKESSSLARHNFEILSNIYFHNTREKIESSIINPGWQFLFKRGWGGKIAYNYQFENVFESFSFDEEEETEVLPGYYSFGQSQVLLYGPQSDLFYWIAELTAGKFYDGTLININLMPTWTISPHVEIGGFYQYSRIRFPDRNQKSNLHLVRFKGLYMLNTELSVSAFIQLNSAADIVVGNFRLRFNPKEGNDLYIVYNENLNRERNREIPVLPLIENRTIALKYTYTFNL
jgi:hypothetical protein